MQDIIERARRIKLVIFDVDGVLTDGRLYLTEEGTEFKAFHVRDGHGLKMLLQCGVHCAIISGRHSPQVHKRMQDLGLAHVYLGVDDKLLVYRRLLEELSLQPEQTAHVGDDVVDLPLMCRAGLAIAVQDADPFVKRHAHWHTANPGGRGAAREVCELILEAQGRLQPLLDGYLATS